MQYVCILGSRKMFFFSRKNVFRGVSIKVFLPVISYTGANGGNVYSTICIAAMTSFSTISRNLVHWWRKTKNNTGTKMNFHAGVYKNITKTIWNHLERWAGRNVCFRTRCPRYSDSWQSRQQWHCISPGCVTDCVSPWILGPARDHVVPNCPNKCQFFCRPPSLSAPTQCLQVASLDKETSPFVRSSLSGSSDDLAVLALQTWHETRKHAKN